MVRSSWGSIPHCSSFNRVTCSGKAFGIYSTCVCVQRLETDAEATEMAIAFFVGITLCFQSSLGKESSHKTRAGTGHWKTAGSAGPGNSELKKESTSKHNQVVLGASIQHSSTSSLHAITRKRPVFSTVQMYRKNANPVRTSEGRRTRKKYAS